MRRRVLLGATAAVALTPGIAQGQQSVKRHRIAGLYPGSRAYGEQTLAAIRKELRVLGRGEDDIEIVVRYADGDLDRLPVLAAELVRLTPEVIVAGGPAPIIAAKRATATIPIVMWNVADPVALGFVASLAHPGGNVTGLANLAQETVGKRLELLKTVVPEATRIAILFNPGNPGNVAQAEAARQAAGALRIELVSAAVRRVEESEGAFTAIAQQRAEALFVPDDPVFSIGGFTTVKFAASHRLPAIYQSREHVTAGGLMSYGNDLQNIYRQVAGYVDKILRSIKPADLPVEQPTKYELVINLKTAKALGLTIPPSILARLDEVIE